MEFSKRLFASRDPQAKLSELITLQKEMASQTKNLLARAQDWEESLHPALRTLHLNSADHQEVAKLIAHYRESDKGETTALLPYSTSHRTSNGEEVNESIANLPATLREKVSLFQRGFNAEDSSASRVLNQALSQYVESINRWLEIDPQRAFPFPIDALENLLFDVHTFLRFMKERQGEHEQILFEFRRHDLKQPAWYQSLYAQLQFSMNEKKATLALLNGKLMPLLKRPAIDVETHRLIQNILDLFSLKTPGFPQLKPHPDTKPY